MKFEDSIGGHVECVRSVERQLTRGMRYRIKDISTDDGTVLVHNDLWTDEWYPASYFDISNAMG